MTDLKHPQQNKNFAIAKGPVNRRTAAPRPEPYPDVPEAVKARLQQKALRHRLGTPLAQQIAASSPRNTAAVPVRTTHILQAVGASTGAVGVVLGAVQSALIWLLGGAALLAGVGVWVVILKRKSALARMDSAQTAIEIVAIGDLQKLDALMELLATQSPDSIAQLTALKAGVARCAVLVSASHAQGGFLGDDVLYVGEAVRRYIPDSITSYLQIPAKDREALPLENGQTASTLLHAQLALLAQELAVREARLGQVAGEDLLRQQRFLATKSAQRL